MNHHLSSEDMVRALTDLQSPHKEESCACAWHPDNVTVEMMVSLIQQLRQVTRVLGEIRAEVARLREIETAAKAYQEWSRTAQEWCGYCDGKNEDHPCSCADKAWVVKEKRKALFAILAGKVSQECEGEQT